MSMRKGIYNVVTAALAAVAFLGMTGCDSVDDERLPSMAVRIDFPTVGDWNTYGVAGALDWRCFIKSSHQPDGFPYPAASATGFGGVLLAGGFDGTPLAFDLSCPVEVKPDVRVSIDADASVARCKVCGSTYDVFRTGAPLSGPAADKGYALTRYRVTVGGSALDYARITR